MSRAIYAGRMAAALVLLRAARRERPGYVAWRLFRWSLRIAPQVTEEQRIAALYEWDRQGYLWGFRAHWPERPRGKRGDA